MYSLREKINGPDPSLYSHLYFSALETILASLGGDVWYFVETKLHDELLIPLWFSLNVHSGENLEVVEKRFGTPRG